MKRKSFSGEFLTELVKVLNEHLIDIEVLRNLGDTWYTLKFISSLNNFYVYIFDSGEYFY